jgi:hypothetical protein
MVNNYININKTKERLNSDGQQFHQYQQNKRKVKQWWSIIASISPLISTHWTSNKITLNGVGNPGPGLWMPQKRGGVKSTIYSFDTPWRYIYGTV